MMMTKTVRYNVKIGSILESLPKSQRLCTNINCSMTMILEIIILNTIILLAIKDSVISNVSGVA